MDDETYTVCPYCAERIDSHEPGAVYAVEQIEVTTMGPTQQVIDDLGGYFHEACPPEVVGYTRQPPPTTSS